MLLEAPICIMGTEIKLTYESFIVRGNQIHVVSSKQMQPVNFAACWNGICPEQVIGAKRLSTVHALYPVVPILFHQHSSGLLHLCLDFFRNEWMVGPSTKMSLPLPEFRMPGFDEDVESTIEGSWFSKVGWTDESWQSVGEGKYDKNGDLADEMIENPPPKKKSRAKSQFQRSK